MSRVWFGLIRFRIQHAYKCIRIVDMVAVLCSLHEIRLFLFIAIATNFLNWLFSCRIVFGFRWPWLAMSMDCHLDYQSFLC